MTQLRPKNAAFVGKDIYRKRRMRDLARAVPIIGAILLTIPLLWADTMRNSAAIVYIFVVWLLLTIMAAAISRAVLTEPTKDP